MTFGIYSPWVIPVALLLALGTARLLSRWHAAPAAGGRFASIDGLRGFLAFFVFLTHGSVWFVMARQHEWALPGSNLFLHLGQSSVALFFMITAFLFTAKVLDSKTRPIDWMRLYVSRVMRLFPLYAFAVALMWLMAWALTGWTLQVRPGQLLVEALDWMAFTIPGAPEVNGWHDADLLMAGVTWSLPYEWWFYLCLPALGLAMGRRAAWGWITFGVVNFALFRSGWHLRFHYVMPFVGGVAAAFAIRSEALCRWARHRTAGLVVLACLAATVLWTHTAYDAPAVMLLSTAFILMACGNDLFGILSSEAARMLGEMTYSIYLLHGLLLSFVFRWVIGLSAAAQMSATQHWGLMFGLEIPLILASFATYRLIEVPAQRAAPIMLEWLRGRQASSPAEARG